MKVRVGFTDVLFGKRSKQRSCMVARAVNRAIPGCVAQVGGDDITVLGGPEPLTARIPEFVVEKIIAFDAHRWVWPFSFELRLQEVPARLPAPAEMLETVLV